MQYCKNLRLEETLEETKMCFGPMPVDEIMVLINKQKAVTALICLSKGGGGGGGWVAVWEPFPSGFNGWIERTVGQYQSWAPASSSAPTWQFVSNDA